MKTAWRRNVVNTSLADISGSGLVCNTALLPVTRSHGGGTGGNAIFPIVTLTDYITNDLSEKDSNHEGMIKHGLWFLDAVLW